MVVKVYVSGISGNKEVKKRQQRVLMILDSKTIKYDVIDITEPGKESEKEFMQNNSKCNGATVSDPNPRHPLPPQIFNDDEYCGDYDQFDMANEVDTLEQFVKVEMPTESKSVSETQEDEAKITISSEEKTTVVNGTDNIDKKNEDSAVDENEDHKDVTESKEEIVKISEENEKTIEQTESPEVKDDTAVIEEKTNDIEEDGDKETEAVKNEVSEEKVAETLKDEPTIENERQEDRVGTNGTTSSREHSEEKQEIEKKEISIDSESTEIKKEITPSEALIESEKAAE